MAARGPGAAEGAILSIQSAVTYGHVGNSAAVFPLQRLGREVWPVDTVQFSNHPGYGGHTGRAATGPEIAALVEGLAARGVLGRCAAVLSGYLGEPGVGAAVADAVDRVRAARPDALYCCDPVIGDTAPGIYVRPGIPALFRDRLLPMADIATPNQFELELLTGLSCPDVTGARAALDGLRGRMRPDAAVLVTSLATAGTPADGIDLMAAGPSGAWRLRTPRLAVTANGTGDAIAALFLLHMLDARDVAAALSAAASALFGVIRRTEAAGSRELLLVEAQEELVRPSRIFTAEPV